MKPLPSQEALRGLFSYQDGQLLRDGKVAGSINRHGYCNIRINKKQYYRHRLVWKMLKGEDPDYIDHINGVKGDDRIENLRSTSQRFNTSDGWKRHKRSGLPTGVHVSTGGRYTAVAILPSGRKCLGTYDTPEQAHQAYLEAVNGKG